MMKSVYKSRPWIDVLDIISGKNQKNVVDDNGKFPIYGSGGIIGYANDFLCEAGTTIVGRKGTINNPIFVNTRFWNVDTAFGLSPKDGLLPKYLYFFCQLFNFKKLDKSTTIPSLSKRDLQNIQIPVPDRIKEQERIVNRIEELFFELDKGVETLKSIKQQLEVYRQAVLKEAFKGKLTNGIDPEYVTLKNYIEKPRYGTSKKCIHAKTSNSTGVIRIPNIDTWSGTIIYNDVKYAVFDAKELEVLDLQEGDLLIIRSNGSVSLVGRTAYIRDIDCKNTFAGYLIRLRIVDRIKLLPKYLLLFLSSCRARIYIESVAKSTSGVNNINAQEISNILIPYVNITEQRFIINEIESRLSVCDNIEQTVETALRKTDTMRQSILKQAFEGRLL